MTAPDPEATRDYSRGDGAETGDSAPLTGAFAALLAAAAAGSVALILADLSTLFSVSVVGVPGRSVSGHHQHGWALAVCGAVGLWLVYSGWRGARLAMLGLAVLGVVALAIAIIGDVPDVHATGVFGALYENAQAQPRAGFYEETLGGVLLLMGGGGLLALGYQR